MLKDGSLGDMFNPLYNLTLLLILSNNASKAKSSDSDLFYFIKSS